VDIQSLSPGKLRILQAVASLLEDPSSKITISRLAAKISVTEAAIYRHYKSKDEIFAALFDYMESHFLTPLNYVQKESTSTDKRLQFIFKQYMEFFHGHPGLARLMLGQGSNEASGISEKVQILNAKIRGQIALIIKWGEAKGHVKSGLMPEAVADLFYGLIVAAAMSEVFNLPQLTVETRWQNFEAATLNRVA